MSNILIKNCFYIFKCSELGSTSGEDIFIKDNIIDSIGKNLNVEASQVIDASKLVVIPGLINTHHHFYQTLTRNVQAVQNAKLFNWLLYLYEVWKNIDEEAIYNSSLLAMCELLKTGCTTTTDHHYLYPNGITDIMSLQFKASDKCGMRFSPTRGSMSLSKKDGGLPPDTVVQTEDTILRDSEYVINHFHDDGDFSMKKIVLAPCSPFSVTKSLMKETASLARKHKVRIHTHLAETIDENSFCERIYGKRPLALMEECDFIGDDVFYAHGIHFNDEELDILSKTKSHVAHCPSSNMRLGSGICRVKEMLEKGINVSIAVDGSASNDASDMLGELRQTLLLQRVHYGADAIDAKTVFDIATTGGAKALGYSKLGKIEVGFGADIAMFNVQKLEYAGALSDPLASLIFSGYNHECEYNIVNGKVVVEKGSVVGVDEDKLFNDANRISTRLLSKI